MSVYWKGRGFIIHILVGKGVSVCIIVDKGIQGPYIGWEGGLGSICWLGRGIRGRILV